MKDIKERLKGVNYLKAKDMSSEDKEHLSIDKNYRGLIALESWEINNKLVIIAVPIKSLVKYILKGVKS